MQVSAFKEGSSLVRTITHKRQRDINLYSILRESYHDVTILTDYVKQCDHSLCNNIII